MPAITVRNLTEETHRSLKLRAARHGRSTEAEVREILEAAVSPDKHIKVGTELAELGQRFRETNLDLARDQTPTEPAVFD